MNNRPKKTADIIRRAGSIETELDRIAKIVREMLDLYRREKGPATQLVLLDVLHDSVISGLSDEGSNPSSPI
jgi:signal transduction histidine kinase